MPSILLTNLRSINNKFDEFKIQVYSLNPDVIICSETWLSSSTPTEACDLAGYTCHRTDRMDDSGYGGVAIWTKTYLKATKLHVQSFERFDICAVDVPSNKLIVVGLYLPPGINSPLFKQFCDSFVDIMDGCLADMSGHRLLVAGDFNQYDRSFLTSNFSLRNIVTGPTRLNANLDLIFVDKSLSQFYVPSKVEIGPPIGSSDHNTVFAWSSNKSRKREFTRHTVYDLRESHLMAFEREFLSRDFSRFYSNCDIEEKCSIFYQYIYEALAVIPRSEVILTDSDAPWMSPLVKLLIEKRWNAFRSRNWGMFNVLKAKVRDEVTKAKKRFFEKKSKSVKGL